MKNKIAIVISPNYKDYASKYLADLMESIRKQTFEGEFEVFITDNETSPASFDLLRKLAPEAELVLNTGNDGFAKGCNDSIRQALQSNFEYIFLVNMDTVLEKDCIKNIVKFAHDNPDAALIQPRIMLWDKRGLINSLGNSTHFLGFGYCDAYNKNWNQLKKPVQKEITYPSGAGVLMRVRQLREIGLFDEEMWMYNEDQDLGLRTWLLGYKCLLAEKAVLYHKYEFAKSIKQYYWMDRNRIIVVHKHYRLATLILILPAYMIMELGLVLFSIKGGWFKEKLRVWAYFWKPSTWKYIYQSRKDIAELRVRKDKDILKILSGRIWYQEIDDWKLRLVNPVFELYLKVLRLVVFW